MFSMRSPRTIYQKKNVKSNILLSFLSGKGVEDCLLLGLVGSCPRSLTLIPMFERGVVFDECRIETFAAKTPHVLIESKEMISK